MKTDTKTLLFDVISACHSVEQFTAGQSFEKYDASDILRSAVERKLEIIGEALSRLRAEDPETFGRIQGAPAVGVAKPDHSRLQRRQQPDCVGYRRERTAEA